MSLCLSYSIFYIYIYIYIYIVILRQTVSLYHNSSVWLDTEDAWSWDWNPPNFTLDLYIISYRTRRINVHLFSLRCKPWDCLYRWFVYCADDLCRNSCNFWMNCLQNSAIICHRFFRLSLLCRTSGLTAIGIWLNNFLMKSSGCCRFNSDNR